MPFTVVMRRRSKAPARVIYPVPGSVAFPPDAPITEEFTQTLLPSVVETAEPLKLVGAEKLVHDKKPVVDVIAPLMMRFLKPIVEAELNCPTTVSSGEVMPFVPSKIMLNLILLVLLYKH